MFAFELSAGAARHRGLPANWVRIAWAILVNLRPLPTNTRAGLASNCKSSVWEIAHLGDSPRRDEPGPGVGLGSNCHG